MSFSNVFAQNGSGDRKAPPPPPPPAPRATPPRIAQALAQNLDNLPKGFESTSENRKQAYAKLLEGQRHIWKLRRINPRNRLRVQNGANMARNSLRETVELDPTLAEAYTALAELYLSAPPQDIDEAINLSRIATKLDKNNYGGHKYLARLYTIKSNIGRQILDKKFVANAIFEWNELTRLDPSNMEAWAFLSEFYRVTNKPEKRIEALKNWMSSTSPLEVGFFSRVLVQEGRLTTENAAIKLGGALIEAGKNKEALGVLTRAVSDSPKSLDAVDLLTQALENADTNSLNPAIEALRQAVFSNPENISLSQILAQTIARVGDIDDAAKLLKGEIVKYSFKDKNTAASFGVSLGDIYSEASRTDKAISSYKDALKIRGVEDKELSTDEERDFAFLVINKMINTYKKANRIQDAKTLIESYRMLFGQGDLSLEREVISLLREYGNKQEALDMVISARKTSPNDYNLIRTQASLLTDLGRVDEGVKIIQDLIDKKPANVAPSIMYEDFINYIYISSLYLQSKRGKDAIAVSYKAIESAKGKENKQIGRMTLASAHQSINEFDEAEKILNDVLTESPNNPIALNNLGYLYLESGVKFQEALVLINKAIKIDPRNPSYLDSLGWAYFKLGKFDKAEKYLTKALNYDTSSATILEHLGDVYVKLGKTNEARDTWKKALLHTSNSDDSKRINAKIAR